MKKRRRRTSRDIPAKGRLRDMADQMWSLAVKNDWGHRCAFCGKRGDLNSHHLFPRQHEATRYLLKNGICLDSRHHQFCPDVSPHQNAAGFIRRLKETCPLLAEWYFDSLESGLHHSFTGTTNARYFCGVIQSLREYVEDDDFRRICGQKFSAWLDANAEELLEVSSGI